MSKIYINIENILYDDFKNMCRTCTLNNDVKFTRNNVISDVYYKLTGRDFETNDELPQQICQKCYEYINGIHEFASRCEQIHSNLMDYLNNVKIKRLEQKPEFVEIIESDKIKDEITVDENNEGLLPIENINLINEFDDNEMMEVKPEISTETDALNDDMISGTSEFNNEENIHYFQDNLSISNTSNFIGLNDEIYEDTDSSCGSSNNSTKQKKRKRKKLEIYKCNECNKKFKYLQAYNKHKKIDCSERPYKCTLCPRACRQSSDLKRHMRIHSGERPFVCDKCPQSFYASNNLQTHKRTHSGERPYTCNLCAKTFNQSCSLNRHMLVHSGERPHKCPICDKCFAYTYQLKRHNKLHNKID